MPCIFEEGMVCYKKWQYEDLVDARQLFVLNADFYPEMDIKYFVFRFVSDEYDRYLRDLAAKFDLHGDEFASHYSMEPIYSNVVGGKGIFGGQCKTQMTYSYGYSF